eukprot:5409316-Lingulodinium_polyedra.AAC.1
MTKADLLARLRERGITKASRTTKFNKRELVELLERDDQLGVEGRPAPSERNQGNSLKDRVERRLPRTRPRTSAAEGRAAGPRGEVAEAAE